MLVEVGSGIHVVFGLLHCDAVGSDSGRNGS